jgi:hypothetical protein
MLTPLCYNLKDLDPQAIPIQRHELLQNDITNGSSVFDGNLLKTLPAMRFPHFNRRTGLSWWHNAVRPAESPELILAQEQRIADLLGSDGSFAVAKIGTTELMALEYFDRWIQLPWPPSASWWRPAQRLYHTAGFFPIKRKLFFRWRDTYLHSLRSLDYVPQWQTPETFLAAYEDRALSSYVPQATRITLQALHPIHPLASWLNVLCQKKWLVITPFKATIQHQLPLLSRLGIYPENLNPLLSLLCDNCMIIRCPQLPYLEIPRHQDWFEALEDLKSQMESQLFDVALIGAGAWSVPLAAHAKHLGKKALHLGGQLQLLFGIKGGRWEKAGIYNEFWTRPLPQERPQNFKLMEKGAYW